MKKILIPDVDNIFIKMSDEEKQEEKKESKSGSEGLPEKTLLSEPQKRVDTETGLALLFLFIALIANIIILFTYFS